MRLPWQKVVGFRAYTIGWGHGMGFLRVVFCLLRLSKWDPKELHYGLEG